MLYRLKDQFEDASRRYAEANGLRRDPDWFLLKLQEELGELTQVSNKLTGRGRTHGRSEAELRQALADETADTLGHILLFARANGIDLPQRSSGNGASGRSERARRSTYGTVCFPSGPLTGRPRWPSLP